MAFYGMEFEKARSLPQDDQDGLLANLPLIESYRSWYRANEHRPSNDFMKMLVERVMKDRPMEAMDYMRSLLIDNKGPR